MLVKSCVEAALEDVGGEGLEERGVPGDAVCVGEKVRVKSPVLGG